MFTNTSWLSDPKIQWFLQNQSVKSAVFRPSIPGCYRFETGGNPLLNLTHKNFSLKLLQTTVWFLTLRFEPVILITLLKLRHMKKLEEFSAFSAL